MYVDQDDMVEPEALQRMYDLGSANDADIVLGQGDQRLPRACTTTSTASSGPAAPSTTLA